MCQHHNNTNFENYKSFDGTLTGLYFMWNGKTVKIARHKNFFHRAESYFGSIFSHSIFDNIGGMELSITYLSFAMSADFGKPMHIKDYEYT